MEAIGRADGEWLKLSYREQLQVSRYRLQVFTFETQN
jgi:hypothetical protein